MEKRNNKKKYKMVIGILSVLLMFSIALNVSGSSSLVEITEAYLNNGITVMLHGKKFEATDPSDGTKYVPITYKGRTYLPMRAVAEAVGLKVTWDPNTETAYLGDVSGDIAKDTISWIKASPEYGGYGPRYRLKSRQPEMLTAGDGTVFEFGYFAENGAGQSETFNTNFEYDKFKVRFWVDEEKDEEGKYMNSDPNIEISDENGTAVKNMNVEYGRMYEVEVDIKDVKELYVWVRGGKSIIGEPMLGR